MVAALTFEQARECVISQIARARDAGGFLLPLVEELPLFEAAGRVLAEDVQADRDLPPLSRSVRDGFAVRAEDLPGDFLIIGEVRAGEIFNGEVHPGEAVEIMTGAPMPAGANCVVMVEHCRVDGNTMSTSQRLDRTDNVSLQGSEARRGEVVLERGKRLGFAEIALLASIGKHHPFVYGKPTVAIVATGDEIVDTGDIPLDYQIRNSNAESLALQVARAGGIPDILPIARDNYESTRAIAERGLESDMLLLSGGVSAGKYDIVERVLGDLGAEFF